MTCNQMVFLVTFFIAQTQETCFEKQNCWAAHSPGVLLKTKKEIKKWLTRAQVVY